jgi:hypothetical protein
MDGVRYHAMPCHALYVWIDEWIRPKKNDPPLTNKMTQKWRGEHHQSIDSIRLDSIRLTKTCQSAVPPVCQKHD